MLIGQLGTNFSEISIGIQTFSFTQMHLNISSRKWHLSILSRPHCVKGGSYSIPYFCRHITVSVYLPWQLPFHFNMYSKPRHRFKCHSTFIALCFGITANHSTHQRCLITITEAQIKSKYCAVEFVITVSILYEILTMSPHCLVVSFMIGDVSCEIEESFVLNDLLFCLNPKLLGCMLVSHIKQLQKVCRI